MIIMRSVIIIAQQQPQFMKSRIPFIISLCTFSLAPLATAEVLTLESKNGQKIIVTLLSRQGDKVLIRRSSDNKEFAISPDSLSPTSAELLRTKMNSLKAAYPPIETVVSISKKRRGASYSHDMEVKAKVTVTNQNYKIPCPPSTVNIILITQNQSNKSQFRILSNQVFDITPTPEGVSKTTSPVTTHGSYSYGYKYVGYLIVIKDKDKKVIQTKTLYSGIKKALETNVDIANTLSNYTANTLLGKDMKKPGSNERSSNEVK